MGCMPHPASAPLAGSYQWTVAYSGDANNEPTSTLCGATNQTSVVAKASPSLTGVATSTVVGSSITDKVTLAGGFGASGEIVFRAYGPGDTTCATKPKHEVALTVAGDGVYSPPGFSPAPGLYRWTVEYEGDANNESSSLPCNAENQGSAVGTIAVVLTASAGGGTIGVPINATASIQEGAIPGGQITFKAFSPGDTNCSGAPAFSFDDQRRGKRLIPFGRIRAHSGRHLPLDRQLLGRRKPLPSGGWLRQSSCQRHSSETHDHECGRGATHGWQRLPGHRCAAGCLCAHRHGYVPDLRPGRG